MDSLSWECKSQCMERLFRECSTQEHQAKECLSKAGESPCKDNQANKWVCKRSNRCFLDLKWGYNHKNKAIQSLSRQL